MVLNIRVRAATYLTIAVVALAVAHAGCITNSPDLSSPPHPPILPTVQLQQNASEVAPAEILGMARIIVSTGPDALQRSKQRHIGDIENIEDVAIIHYSGDEMLLTLWTTSYQNEALASSETEKMVTGIHRFGGDWASTLKEITVNGKTVYQIEPDGMPQYFWSDGRWMFYFIAHNIPPDKIPTVIRAIPE
ncbi:MAG: hypothetical protein EF813_11025 [Methanosarcinales archaeon]|nr:MAG: hypothetical protein EF813_11025 [Methanosarcinales archaeon]